MITRKQYMENSSELHHDYYMQFATEGMKDQILRIWPKEVIQKCYSGDPNLNNLPGEWMKQMDLLTTFFYKKSLARKSRAINGTSSYSLSMGICVYKAIMKEICTNQS
jgi:hypothetical protein